MPFRYIIFAEKNFMCIFDFLDILFGKDAKKDKQNAIPFTDGEEECDNCGDYIEDCECDCDDKECD